MSDKVLLRSEVDRSYTWDLSSIYPDKTAFLHELDTAARLTQTLEEQYKGKLTRVSAINKALDIYRDFKACQARLGAYGFLSTAVDLSDADSQKRKNMINSRFADMNSRLSFIDSEIIQNDESIIKQAIDASVDNSGYLKEILRFKPHALHPEVEKTLKSLVVSLDAPFDIYNKAKLTDLDYDSFQHNGIDYPMSFVLFENVYQASRDTALRRKSFEIFSKNLRRYNHTIAAAYNAKLQTEKTMSDLRGFDSIFDYLLFNQKVDRAMYDRQIDTIMDRLAAPMRKYVTLLKEANNLDRLTYPDLKIALDYDFEPQIDIEGSKPYVFEALSVYGEAYSEMVRRAFDERWIDFVQNKGKRSGAFCSSPYGAHPFILISWSQRMMEVFVLAHELGHAGHFFHANAHQNVFNTRPSLYFIEAPSTMNEMLMANHLIAQQPDDLRFRRWVLSCMISRTYYHNFVTHLLEAHFQREVYKLIDAGGSVQASDLNRLKLATLKQFWGDAVDIDQDAELTWMRQLHYYKGLYPYTYSAGLTIATAVNKRYRAEGQVAIEDWKNVLKAGGTKTPVELAAMAGVDITSDKPLNDTIDYISALIDEIADITKQLK